MKKHVRVIGLEVPKELNSFASVEVKYSRAMQIRMQLASPQKDTFKYEEVKKAEKHAATEQITKKCYVVVCSRSHPLNCGHEHRQRQRRTNNLLSH